MIFDRPSAKRFEQIKVDGIDEPVNDSVEIGKTAFQLIEGTEDVRVLRHYGNKAAVSVPEEVTVAKKAYRVTEIGDSAFEGCSWMTSISLPDSVTSIGNHAFEGCTGLTEVSIPKEIVNIRGKAFAGCTGLVRIFMRNGPETIGRNAFEGCSSLKEFVVEKGKGDFESDSHGILYKNGMKTLVRVPFAVEGTVDIPPMVEELTDASFSGCGEMTSVRIPESVRIIGDKVFSGCNKLAMLYVHPNNSRYRSDLQGILYNSDATEVIRAPNSIVGALEVPGTVKRICACAFEGCDGLLSISIPYSTTEIGDSAFEGCTKVRSLALRGGVVTIGESAFRGCSGIISVTIPDGVESIGDRAFFGCSRLRTVSIPLNTRVGEQAFPANCDIVME